MLPKVAFRTKPRTPFSAHRPVNRTPITLEGSGMSCEGCVTAVEDAILDTDGVAAVVVNLQDGQARVERDVEAVSLGTVIEAAEDDATTTSV